MNKLENPTIYTKRAHPYLLMVLMCTIAVDIMGFGLVIPIFPRLFFTNDCVFAGYSLRISYLLYGLGFALWPLGNFFGTPYLGLLSDKYGRKKILVICLFATGFSYVLTALSIYINDVFIFLLTRIFAGFFGGSYDIAQAGVADISLPENKARNMALISFAVSIGIILGPALSGFTTEKNLISWFSLTTPFWISGFLAFINAFFILFWFKETYVPNFIKNKIEVGLLKIFSSFLFVFKDKRVVVLGMSFLCFQFAWGIYITTMPLILENVFQASIQGTGFFFCVLGAGIAFSILFIQKKILVFFSLFKSGLVFLALLVLFSIFLIIFQKNLFFQYVTVFIYGVCDLLVYSSLLAMCSNSVTKYEQGKIMGGIGAVACLAFFFSGVLSSVLVSYDIRLPAILIAVSFVLSFLFLLKNKR